MSFSVVKTYYVDAEDNQCLIRTWPNGNVSHYIEDGQKHHRLDGPARDWENAREWFYYGERINCQTQDQFDRIIKLKAFL